MIAGRHRAHSMETASHASSEIAAQLETARAALALLGANADALDPGLEAAQAVASLTNDAELAIATALHWVRQAGLPGEPGQAAARLGAVAARLAAELERLGQLHLPAGWSASQGLNAQQAEMLRKMLLAVAAEP